MNLIEETVAEFGRSMGMSNLTLRQNGGLALAIHSIGTLAFDVAGPRQDSVVVSLSKPIPRGRPVDPRRLLGFAHYRSRPRVPVQLGARDGQLVLAVVLPQEEFTLPRITEVIRALDQQHHSMEASL